MRTHTGDRVRRRETPTRSRISDRNRRGVGPRDRPDAASRPTPEPRPDCRRGCVRLDPLVPTAPITEDLDDGRHRQDPRETRDQGMGEACGTRARRALLRPRPHRTRAMEHRLGRWYARGRRELARDVPARDRERGRRLRSHVPERNRWQDLARPGRRRSFRGRARTREARSGARPRGLPLRVEGEGARASAPRSSAHGRCRSLRGESSAGNPSTALQALPPRRTARVHRPADRRGDATRPDDDPATGDRPGLPLPVGGHRGARDVRGSSVRPGAAGGGTSRAGDLLHLHGRLDRTPAGKRDPRKTS